MLCLIAAQSVLSAQTASAVTNAATLFPLREVRLLDGPVQVQQEMNRRYLLKLEPDRLLSWFRREAGLEPKAPPYRGWESESPQLPGHILGFYLSGAAMMVQATGDEELHYRLDYIVDQLAEVQAANGSGYMLAVPGGKKIFADIAAGQIQIGGLPWTGYQINGNFEPTYTLNKLMLGLYQVYLATGNEKAKQVLIRLADWFGHNVLDALNDAQVQTLLDCEHGSINESFAEVFQLTGDRKYLVWARRLCHERMLQPLAANDGKFLDHYHANTQIPKFTGFEAVYALNGERELDAAAVNFWNDVVSNRSWVIGGNGANEHFFPTNDFDQALHAAAGPESCNSVNMLRLTEALYQLHPSVALMDYYERTLFNHILAVHDPERGMFAYYTGMQPGSYRVYSDEFDSMWCCVGTGLEVPGKYGQMIFTHTPDNSALDVNLFIAAELNWPEKQVKVTQETQFPAQEGVKLKFICEKPNTKFALRIRHPWWVPDGKLQLKVNGRVVRDDSRNGEYAEINKNWRTGDTVEVQLPMHLSCQALPGDEHYVALLYGPIVLSGELGRSGGLSKEDFWQIHDTLGRKNLPESRMPMFLVEEPADILSHVQAVPGEPLTFEADGLTISNRVRLIPFFQNHFQRYAIYWRCLTPEEFQSERSRQALTAQHKREIEAQTVDQVRIGDEASETAHHLKSSRSFDGPGSSDDDAPTHWRDARDGGWFSYDLKIVSDFPVILRSTYWGQDGGERTFDILVDGQKVTTLSLKDTGHREFYDIDVPLAAELLAGKNSVTVTFQARPNNTAGGLFDLRIVKKSP